MNNPDRKNRCQGITTNGQCQFTAQVGSVYCISHGQPGVDLEAEEDKRLYQLLKSEDRAGVNKFDQQEFRTLQAELALVRVLIEEQVNLRHDRIDLLQSYGPINTLFLTAEKLNTAIVQLEQSLETLMSRPTLLAFGAEIVKVVQTELAETPDSEAIINRLSRQIILAIGSTGRETSPIQRILTDGPHFYNLLNPKYQQRLVAFWEHSDTKHLREEIAIARMLLEERFNRIHSDSDFLAACGMLNSQLLTILQLVQSTHKTEQKLGSLLTKATLQTINTKLVTILVDELKPLKNYEDLVDRIGGKIIGTIEQMVQDSET
jgi:hypothetical protein